MKILTVIENHSDNENLVAQYGLSLYVTTESGSFLIDAGSNDFALANFKELGLSTDSLSAIVISHNHFDHIGGIGFFIENSAAPLYISSEGNIPLYTSSLFHRKKLVSRCEIMENNPERFRTVEDSLEMLPGIYLCRIKNCDEHFLCKDRRLKKMVGHKLVPDDFSHEIYVAVIENNDCKIISSCSHNGIINIIKDAQRRFPEYKVESFIGGLHMRGSSPRYIREVTSELKELGLKKLYTAHCTGHKAFNVIRQNSDFESVYFSTGDLLEL